MSRFSDGHWRLLPGDPRTNVAWRRDVLAWAKARGRPAERALRRRCERDVLFYFDLFALTYNPLVEPHVFPFVLWENQRAAVLETADVLFGENRSMIWEKTRYEGGTGCAVCGWTRHWGHGPGRNFTWTASTPTPATPFSVAATRSTSSCGPSASSDDS